MAKITTKITSFADVQKSLQEIEKVLNELTSSVNSSAETEISDKDGKTGDIKTQRNADGTYSFEVKTDEGWKVPTLGNSLIKFKDKLNTIRQTTLLDKCDRSVLNQKSVKVPSYFSIIINLYIRASLYNIFPI